MSTVRGVVQVLAVDAEIALVDHGAGHEVDQGPPGGGGEEEPGRIQTAGQHDRRAVVRPGRDPADLLSEAHGAADRRQRGRIHHGHPAGELAHDQAAAVGAVVDATDVGAGGSPTSDELVLLRVPDPDVTAGGEGEVDAVGVPAAEGADIAAPSVERVAGGPGRDVEEDDVIIVMEGDALATGCRLQRAEEHELWRAGLGGGNLGQEPSVSVEVPVAERGAGAGRVEGRAVRREVEALPALAQPDASQLPARDDGPDGRFLVLVGDRRDPSAVAGELDEPRGLVSGSRRTCSPVRASSRTSPFSRSVAARSCPSGLIAMRSYCPRPAT